MPGRCATGRARLFEAIVTDGHGKLTLTFFGRGRQDWRERTWPPRRTGLFSGQVSSFRGKRQLTHPEYELLVSSAPARPGQPSSRMRSSPSTRPVRTAQSWKIADSVRVALRRLDLDSDPLPAEIRAGMACTTSARAERHPSSGRRAGYVPVDEQAEVGRGVQPSGLLAQRRRPHRVRRAAPARSGWRAAGRVSTQQLPFQLTAGQQTAGAVIADDLGSEHPMHRLLQGEVGSGKTIVALRAMLQVIDAAGRPPCSPPPRYWPQQHHRSISQMLGPLAMAGQLGGADQATTITLLTGSQGSAVRAPGAARSGVGFGRDRGRHPCAARGQGPSSPTLA